MPSLHLLKHADGVVPAKHVPLRVQPQVIGRDADKCQIVIPHHSVSREHARITSQNGIFYVEDLNSRNNTFVNDRKITTRTALMGDDRIRICDFTYVFRDERQKPGPLPEWMRKGHEPEEDDPGGTTTIEATQGNASVQEILRSAPSEQLRALLEISTKLSKTLDLDPLLNEVADTLLKLFAQGDRCFVLLLDESDKPIPKAVKTRRVFTEEPRHSRTIVRMTLESMQSYLSEDASSDVAMGSATSIADFKIRSVMCVPLVASNGRPLGVIQLDTLDRSRRFSTDDLNLLAIVANLASVTIEKARLHVTILARDKEQREIELARKVQLGFLPQTLPEIPGYEFYSHYSPAQTVGGDYYDFIPLPGGRVAVVLGDVAGKGVPAALLVAKLSSEVRFCLVTEPTLGKAITVLNEQMLRGGLQDLFVTLAAMILDPLTHQVVLVNAGHVHPKLYLAAKRQLTDAITSEASGFPLGVEPGFAYESVSFTLSPGDMVTTFTDGVTDAMNPTGKMFGSEAADHCLTTDRGGLANVTGPKQVGERLINAVRKHANGRAQNDDVAIVCFGRLVAASG